MSNTPEATPSAVGAIDLIASNRFYSGAQGEPLRLTRGGRFYIARTDLVISALPQTPIGNHEIRANWMYRFDYEKAPWIVRGPELRSAPDCRVFHDATVTHDIFVEGYIHEEQRIDTGKFHYIDVVLIALEIRSLSNVPMRVAGSISVRAL